MDNSFFHGLFWQSLGTAITIVVALSSVIRYFVARSRKSLTYELLSNSPIIEKDARGKVEVWFEEEKVDDVNLVQIRVSNSGNLPIPTTDFEVPLSLIVNGKAHILSAEVLSAIPENLVEFAHLTIQNPNVINVDPFLLNKGDSFTIGCLITKFNGDLEASGRIVGIKAITERREPSKWEPRILSILSIVMMTLSFIIIAQAQPAVPLDIRNAWPGFVFAGIAYTLLIFSIARRGRLRSLKNSANK